MSARLLAAAKVYAFNYLQDEAEEVESCTCGPKQHAEAKELFAAIKEAEAAPLPAEQPSNPVLAHGHREDWYLMANARRIGMLPIAQIKAMSNWVFATQLFATGSASARQICHDAGIDPDGFTMARIVGQQTKGGGNE